MRRFESYWGRFLLPGYMVADLGICRVASFEGAQPDVVRCGSVSGFPEYIRNDPPGPAPRDHEQTTAAITVSDRTLEALHTVPNTSPRHDRRIMSSAFIAVLAPLLTGLNVTSWDVG